MTARTAERGRPLVFVGRYAMAVSPAAEVVDDWQVAPHRLLPLLNETSRLVLLEPLCFPYESLRDVDRDIPVAVALPSLESEELEALLGKPLLDHLGPGDRVAAADETWRTLAESRLWPAEMRLWADPGDPEEVAAKALQPGVLGGRPGKEEGRRRAQALAHLLLGRIGGGSGSGLVADVEGRAGPWRYLLPGYVELLAVSGIAPWPAADESMAGAVALTVFGGLSKEERRALVDEMWRVVRPGGLLAAVDDVVPVPGAGRPGLFARGDFPGVLLGSAGDGRRLDRVWSIRFPGETLHRGAGWSAVKAGGTQS
jgi:hypothetical protein